MTLEANNSAFKLAPRSTHNCCSQEHSLLCSYSGRRHADNSLVLRIVRAARSGRQYEQTYPDLPLAIHRDDIVQGRIDGVAVRRREEADLKRLIAANRRPPRPAPKCDHKRPVRTHTFSDGKVLKLYRCGCSNGAEILNGRKTHGK